MYEEKTTMCILAGPIQIQIRCEYLPGDMS